MHWILPWNGMYTKLLSRNGRAKILAGFGGVRYGKTAPGPTNWQLDGPWIWIFVPRPKNVSSWAGPGLEFPEIRWFALSSWCLQAFEHHLPESPRIKRPATQNERVAACGGGTLVTSMLWGWLQSWNTWLRYPGLGALTPSNHGEQR